MKFLILFITTLNIALSLGDLFNRGQNRIVGGQITDIENYPYAVAMMYNQRPSSAFTQWCAGTILSSNMILSAAHCYENSLVWHSVSLWRAKVGSSYGSYGGTYLQLRTYIPHPEYWPATGANDIIVLQTSTHMDFGSKQVAPVSIAGGNYPLYDNEKVWAIGWGWSEVSGSSNDILREVDVLTINQEECSRRYPLIISPSHLCTGWLDIGGKDQCQGDSGGPVIHKGARGDVVVGICSFGQECGSPSHPGVNTRVSAYASWIVNTVMRLNSL